MGFFRINNSNNSNKINKLCITYNKSKNTLKNFLHFMLYLMIKYKYHTIILKIKINIRMISKGFSRNIGFTCITHTQTYLLKTVSIGSKIIKKLILMQILFKKLYLKRFFPIMYTTRSHQTIAMRYIALEIQQAVKCCKHENTVATQQRFQIVVSLCDVTITYF